MRIAELETDERVLVVAEVGNNHEGDPRVAAELVEAAAASGADAVKFQTFHTDGLVSRADPERYERLLSFELSHEEFTGLAAQARSLGLLFISTPLDLESTAFLRDLVDCYKVASGDNDFVQLLVAIAATGKPAFVSAGMSDLETIARAKRTIEDVWSSQGIVQELAVLHCVSAYPAPADEASLAAIPFLAAELRCTVGYSDHTVGIDVAPLAVAAGARIVEKHFTLDKGYSSFRDHQLSADPGELRRLVEEIRRVERVLGRAGKSPQPSEAETAALARRSIVAASDLPEGHRVTEDDITWLRPAGGLPPGEEAQVVGRVLKSALGRGEPILPSNLH
jgi:sialic acid synthase SpsE